MYRKAFIVLGTFLAGSLPTQTTAVAPPEPRVSAVSADMDEHLIGSIERLRILRPDKLMMDLKLKVRSDAGWFFLPLVGTVIIEYYDHNGRSIAPQAEYPIIYSEEFRSAHTGTDVDQIAVRIPKGAEYFRIRNLDGGWLIQQMAIPR